MTHLIQDRRVPAPTDGTPRRRRAWYKANGLARMLLARNFGVVPGQYLVNEYPKSGGTWFAQMLSAYTGVPYPRLRLPRFGGNVLHAHYLRSIATARTVVVWRDPRDVLVSHFHHCVHVRPETSAANTLAVRRLMGIELGTEIRFEEHFPAFYEAIMSRRIHPYFTWCDFYDEWFERRDVLHTSYERLHADAAGELRRAASFLELDRKVEEAPEAVVERFEFSRLSGRRSGQEHRTAYMRKGIVGDWRNALEPAMLERMALDYGDRLAAYEKSEKVQPMRSRTATNVR